MKFLIISITCIFVNAAIAQDSITLTRNNQWREDLKYLKERFPAYDKTFTPVIYANPLDSNKPYFAIQKNSLDAFLKGIDSLYNSVEVMSNEQIMIGICKLVSLSPNAHTRFYLFRVRTVMNNLPIGIYWFGKDLHITAAPKQYQYILGAKIKSINGFAIDSLKRRVDELISGNSQWEKYMSLYFLRSPQAMYGLSLSTSNKELELIIVKANGKEETLIMQADFVPQKEPVEIWKDLSPLGIKKDSLIHLLPSSQLTLPLYLQNPDKSYYYNYLKKEGLVYLQFNRTENDKDISFVDYTLKMLTEIKNKPYNKFVLDLRFNTGGNNTIAARALSEIAKNLDGKKVYIITGPTTFSGGLSSATLFKWLSKGKIIGEPVGEGLVYLSEGGNVVLPNSKLNAHYANGLHNEVYEKGFNINPDKEVAVTFQDYLKGEDTILNYIIQEQ